MAAATPRPPAKRKSPEDAAAELLARTSDRKTEAAKQKQLEDAGPKDGKKSAAGFAPPKPQRPPRMPQKQGDAVTHRGAVASGKDSARKFRAFIPTAISRNCENPLDADRKWAPTSKQQAWESRLKKIDDYWN